MFSFTGVCSSSESMIPYPHDRGTFSNNNVALYGRAEQGAYTSAMPSNNNPCNSAY